jgi:hypothetical protein
MKESNLANQEYLRPLLWRRQMTLGKLVITMSLKRKEDTMKGQEYLSTFEPDEMSPRHSPFTIQRLVVMALSLSFAASLATCWLNWILPGSAVSWLPGWLTLMIENQRIATLLVPLVCLLVCYGVLRAMRGDIKMLREQAHGSAYKLLKRACLLLPVGLLLYNMYWHAPASVSPPPARPPVVYFLTYTSQLNGTNIPFQPAKTNIQLQPANLLPAKRKVVLSLGGGFHTVAWIPVGMVSVSRVLVQSHEQSTPSQWLNSPVSMGTFFGTLLLSLFLMITALPMAILAWEGRE